MNKKKIHGPAVVHERTTSMIFSFYILFNWFFAENLTSVFQVLLK